MNWLNLLKKAAKSNTVVYTKFLQQYSVQNKALHIFYEGKDDPSFYSNFVEKHTKQNQKVYYYKCDGKQNVYDNYSKLNWKSFVKSRILFLVDKDYSDILGHSYPNDSNIFVTKYYSVENYLVTKGMFSKCLIELIGVDDSKSEIISKEFDKSLKVFYKLIINLSSYIIFHRSQGNKANLGNIKLKDVVEIDENLRVKKKTTNLVNLDRLCGVNTNNCFSDVKSISKQLKQLSPKLFVRGKFELMFFVSVFNLVPQILNKGLSKGDKKYKISVNLSDKNAVSIIAPRLRQPTDIKKFFDKNLGK